jgi:outer membrane assembly lipoprotein YfgL
MTRTSKSLLAAVLGLALGACSSTPKAPEPTPLTAVAPLLQVRTAWSARVGAVPGNFSAATAGDAVVVASADGQVLSLDARDGRTLWHAQIAGGISAGSGSDGNFTAVVNNANQVVSLGPQGQVLWLYQLPASVLTPPLVQAGTIVVQSADQRLWAFNAASGTRLWSTEASSAASLVLQQAGGLVAQDDALLFGDSLGHLQSLGLANGVARWDTALAHPAGVSEVERTVAITGAPVIAGGKVCARAYQSGVGCADLGDGHLLWTDKVDGDTGVSQDGDLLVAAQADGTVQAYAAADGTRSWDNDKLKYRHLSPPLLIGVTVAVGDYAGYVSFLSAKDGNLVGRASTDGSAIRSPMRVLGKTLVVVTSAGAVYGFVPQ